MEKLLEFMDTKILKTFKKFYYSILINNLNDLLQIDSDPMVNLLIKNYIKMLHLL